MRSTRELIAGMLQRLGKSPSSSVRSYRGVDFDVGVNLYTLLNDAGNELVTCRPWSWRETEIEIPLVDGVESYGLDLSVIALLAAGFVGGGTECVRLVPIETVRECRKRTALTSGPIEFVAALGGGEQETAGVPLRRSLEVYPAPGASTPALTVSVRRGWVNLSESDPDRVPSVPPHWDRLVYLAARRIAWTDQNTSPSPDEKEFQAELERMWDLDQNEQPDMGPMQGDVRPVSEDSDPGYYTGRFEVQF